MSVPPVMVVALFPTFEVTKSPPDVITLVPDKVRVLAAAESNLRLLVVDPLVGELLVVTVVLFPAAQVSLV